LSVAVDDGCGVCGQPRQETIALSNVLIAKDVTAAAAVSDRIGCDGLAERRNVGETVTFTATINTEGQTVTTTGQ
jgi:hypothetical protein